MLRRAGSLRRIVCVAVVALVTGGLAAFTGVVALPVLGQRPGAISPRVRTSTTYPTLPLAFEPNRGQTDARVRFLAHGPGYGLFFTAHGPVMALQHRHAVSLDLLRSHSRITALDRLPGIANYFVGSDPRRWRTAIPTYARVRYAGAWPGVDVDFYGNASRLEYDLRVAPGADPNAIALAFRGTSAPRLAADGGLSLRVGDDALRQPLPVAYQVTGSTRRPVTASYVLGRAGSVRVRVGAYDRRLPLIIDPGLISSTFLGGSGDDTSTGLAMDAAGNLYVDGATSSVDFPRTSGALSGSYGGGVYDGFVSKLNGSGTALLYSTYLGGNGYDFMQGIAVDAAGNAYITGLTGSANFPVTAGAFQTTCASCSHSTDAFLTKLSPSGSALGYSTYLGGSAGAGCDESGDCNLGGDVAVDAAGEAFVTGATFATDFPTTAGAFRTTCGGCPDLSNDAFVTKFNATGTSLVYSTYLNGTTPFPGACTCAFGSGITLDASGDAYVTGNTTTTNFPTTPGAFQTAYGGANADVFVSKLNASGNALVYSTYLGGSDLDLGAKVVIDPSGDAYVAGGSASTDFPVTSGALQTTNASHGFDGFVAKLSPAGSALGYSTYLGGSHGAFAADLALAPGGQVVVTGSTGSSDFPTTADAYQPVLHGPLDVFVSTLNAAGTAMSYSTYLGGGSYDSPSGVALDASGNAVVAGATSSTNFPTSAGVVQPGYGGGTEDAFVTKLTASVSAPSPATLQLSPSAGVGTVDGTALFSATVADSAANPLAGITVRFSVSGSVTTSGSCVTAADGHCSFSYTGPALPGADAITAYADTNADDVHDPGEPSDEATQAWLLPSSTTGQSTGGGQIPNSSGQSKIAFGFTAKSDATGTKGECTVVDVSPQTNIKIKCTDVTSLIRSGVTTTLFGNATVNGTATTYRIDAQDNGEPGVGRDTFKIQMASGYTAGGVLSGGNIQAHS